MEQIAILMGIAFLINKIVTVIKSIGKDNNMVLTQATVWVVGFVIMLLAATAEATAGLMVPGIDTALGDLDFASLLLSSLILGSSGSFAYDIKKAIDGSDNATEPALLTNRKVRGRRD